ncbi:immunoglobulin-like domain-containing receptor 2 [Trichomycterus rosablanca]|uniref:immunoglobulin-like domain-containing receptor 2 n=1 Tax=Trichomycterus rosablanca TaxID=2290929 RepID=UPI002F35CEA7
MKRKRGEKVYDFCADLELSFKRMPSLLKWWITLLYLTGAPRCAAVNVNMRDDRRFAMLFQSVVLPCQYTTSSIQAPVVQWWYKSYCRDRTRDSFSFPNSLGVKGSELGPSSHLDCSDNSRTVRIIISVQGSSVTLTDHYKGRDISIINKADLRIGQLQWGDSGVYYCKVVIADDLEGENEAHVELLVLGQTSVTDDLLPEINLEIMPEWVFVGAVVLGSVLFLVLAGVCWCQCCPHSCCCYVRCCCCPETCCCPRHLYEAGKGLKTTAAAPVAMYPPYFVQGMPTMVPIAPPSFIEPKMSTVSSINNNASTVQQPSVHSGFLLQPTPDQNSMKMLQYVERELAQFNPSKTPSSNSACSMSELSSLHEAETDFRQTYRQVQKKALPVIPDLDDPPDVMSREMSPGRPRGSTRHPQHRPEEEHPRWKPRSEHLQRKAFQMGERRGSLDELEEFAMNYVPRGYHSNFNDADDDHRTRTRQRQCDNDREWNCRREEEPERERSPYYSSKRYYPKNSPDRHRPPSPASPPRVPEYTKRRDTWDSERPLRRHEPWESKARNEKSLPDYDDALLSSLLERKAKSERSLSSFKGGQNGEESDTPSKNSSKKSYRSNSPSNRSANNRLTEAESLPPYTEREPERHRSVPTSYKPQKERENREEQNRPRKVNTVLSRDSLVV